MIYNFFKNIKNNCFLHFVSKIDFLYIRRANHWLVFAFEIPRLEKSMIKDCFLTLINVPGLFQI